MGHEVEKAARERGHQVVYTLDNQSDWEQIQLSPATVDAVIDFSTPDTAARVVQRCLDARISVVSGTTGWSSELGAIKDYCRSIHGSLFYAPNFSIGVNIFFEINRRLAALLSQQDSFSASVHEIHHIHKLDAPSGTAIALANDIIAENGRYSTWHLIPVDQTDIIPVTCERVGEIPGTHSIQWSSASDTIEIKHTAHNRQGFATGAVLAAEWLQGRSGVFGMSDLLNCGT